MIVDPHFHIHSACLAPGEPAWRRQAEVLALMGISIEQEAETLVGRAKSAGIEAIVAMNPFFAPGVGSPRTNRQLYDAIKPYQGFVYGIGGVNLWPRPDLEQLALDVRQLGLRGVKFVPSMGHFYPNDFDLMGPVYEACIDLGISVWWHNGGWQPNNSRSIFCDMRFLDEVARRHPDLKIVLAHLGLIGSAATLEDAASLAGAHANVFLEASFVPRSMMVQEMPLDLQNRRPLSERYLTEFLYKSPSDWSPEIKAAWSRAREEHDHWVRLAINVAPERFMYASDAPYALDFRLARELYEELVPPGELRDLIMGETARSLLHIP